jgi:Flp pilus assembly protein TadB
MIAAWCSALAVVALGAALQPRPAPRRPGAHTRARRSIVLPALPTAWARRGSTIEAAEVAAWCESLARVVRGGSTLIGALHSVAPPPSCRDALDPVILSLRRGGSLRDALDVATHSPHLDLAVTVLRACTANGGPPAEPLDRAAATLRGRAADLADRRTQSAQARLSATVMTVLPIAMLALLLTTSATTRSAATSTTGLAVIVAGAVLNLIGWRWMRRLIGVVSS